MFPRHRDADVAEGRFDPLTLVETSAVAPRTGTTPAVVRELGFVPTELRLLFRVGLSVANIWGGAAGRRGRRPIDLGVIEIMISATKENPT